MTRARAPQTAFEGRLHRRYCVGGLLMAIIAAVGVVANSVCTNAVMLTALGTLERSGDAVGSLLWRQRVRVEPFPVGFLVDHATLWAQARVWFERESDTATALYRQAMDSDPTNPLIALEFGMLSASQGQTEEAIELWRQAGSGRYWAHRARSASGSAASSATFAYLDAALATSPSDPIVQLIAGDLRFDSGDMPSAVEAYSVVIEHPATDESSLGHALTQRARARFAAGGEWTLSEGDLLAALELQPDDTWTHIRLCELYREAGRLQQALSHCSTAVQLAPESAFTHYYLGRALAAADSMSEAIAAFESALGLDPAVESAQHWLERSHAQLAAQDSPGTKPGSETTERPAR